MFAPAYMGRKRWAQPYDRFHHSTENPLRMAEITRDAVRGTMKDDSGRRARLSRAVKNGAHEGFSP